MQYLGLNPNCSIDDFGRDCREGLGVRCLEVEAPLGVLFAGNHLFRSFAISVWHMLIASLVKSKQTPLARRFLKFGPVLRFLTPAPLDSVRMELELGAADMTIFKYNILVVLNKISAQEKSKSWDLMRRYRTCRYGAPRGADRCTLGDRYCSRPWAKWLTALVPFLPAILFQCCHRPLISFVVPYCRSWQQFTISHRYLRRRTRVDYNKIVKYVGGCKSASPSALFNNFACKVGFRWTAPGTTTPRTNLLRILWPYMQYCGPTLHFLHFLLSTTCARYSVFPSIESRTPVCASSYYFRHLSHETLQHSSM